MRKAVNIPCDGAHEGPFRLYHCASCNGLACHSS